MKSVWILCACVLLTQACPPDSSCRPRNPPAKRYPFYTVTVKTANGNWWSGTGTDADVYIILTGSRACRRNLNTCWHNDFERNSHDTFKLDVGTDLGPITHIRLGFNRRWWWDDWKVEYIIVTDPYRRSIRYNINTWLTEGRRYVDLKGVVDGGWSTWRTWGACSKTCGGGGVMYRYRSCNNPAPANGGQSCRGPSREVQRCGQQPCPVHGGWSDWGDFGDCSKTCGGGMKMKTRQCNNPVPAHGGQPCRGSNRETHWCGMDACPVDGGWSDWGDWGACSRTCDGGLMVRARTCDNPPPAHGGAACQGPNKEQVACGQDACPSCRDTTVVCDSYVRRGIPCTHALMQKRCQKTCSLCHRTRSAYVLYNQEI